MSKKDKHKHEPEPEADEAVGPQTPEQERDDLLARLQRVSADYANFQKRVQREKEDGRHFAQAEVIRGLLPVLDDMERALEAARENHGEDDPFFTGMQIVHDKALETLGKFGLTPIEAVGKSFDPDRHSALMQQPTDEHPAQTVLQEVQRGYALNGKTIRPSGVVVSVELPSTDGTAEPEDTSADS